MAQILIHVGFPKTGTSTLQREVFNVLHQRGAINYLGRRSYFHRENGLTQPYKRLEDYWAKGEPFEESDLNLAEDKLNVISNEEFTLPEGYYFLKYGTASDPFSLAGKVKKALSAHDVKFAVTLRNQVDLIYSLYAQYYARFFMNNGQNTFYSHLFDNGNVKTDRLGLFYFDKYLSGFFESFEKERVNVFLYEDMFKRSSDFITGWSEILSVPPGELESMLFSAHHRQRTKTQDNYVLEITDKSPFRYSLRKWLSSLKKKTAKIPFVGDRLKKIQWETKPVTRITIENLSGPEKQRLMEEFRESNLHLISLCGLDEDKLKNYGYLQTRKS